MHARSADDDTVVSAVLTLIQNIENLATERGKAARYRFTNYGYKTQNVLRGYGEESVEKLRQVSKKYDPQAFFQTVVPGGFKVSKA